MLPRLTVVIDTVEVVDRIAAAATELGKELAVLIDVDVGQG